jgi:hypothetical protein
MKRKYSVDQLKKASSTDPDPNGFLIEGYKKHATELASIEDRMNKFLLVVLAVFGAGATTVRAISLSIWPAIFLAVMVVALALAGRHYSHELQDLRGSTRHLLVRCEIAMGFYTQNEFLSDEPLYTLDELDYPNGGQFLGSTPVIFIFVAGIVLLAMIYASHKGVLAPSTVITSIGG